ncbi:DUF317 domain-containing protein [Streptomyces sp. Wh19]|uniref:DUF317 domain-containing protein n=1 Tax=Streptomyces sp. Wh19 TaxID=3076629 RepID=UPI002958CDFD|nr:DUF317 domain-containing protein [Streptomyces sp. Wh19]MDV9194366.1 DUF317 domain-containing protein [Streptomyces sp. Wh19]
MWRISASENPVSEIRWSARVNQNTPPEFVHGLTSALAAEWSEGSDTFLAPPSYWWTDAVQPFIDAGWERKPLSRGIMEIVSPDQLAGVSIDVVNTDPHADVYVLWAGPPGWGTRAEASFTARTPRHLIAAMAAAIVDPSPVIRTKALLNPRLAQLAQLTPVSPPRPTVPTPRDVQHQAARRPAAVGTSSVPRWSTDTPPPVGAGGSLPPRRR